jgi:peptide deformylase
MALRQIRKRDDFVLRKKAEMVNRFTPGLLQLLDDMAETMSEAEGAGLAAPQVGISKRVIVFQNSENGIIELINPEIISTKGNITDIEGCLSLPGIYGEVPRAEHVQVIGLNREGKEVRLEAQGFLARVLQHEIDHLEGILFIDRATHLLTPDELAKLRQK